MGENRNVQSIRLSEVHKVTFGDITNVGVQRQERPAPKARPACRVLLLAANPSGTPHLRLDREARAIEDALRTAPDDRRYELLHGWAASSLDLQQDLFLHRPELIHFSGHGGAAGDLALEARQFRDLMRQGPGTPHAPQPASSPAPIAALVRMVANAPGDVRGVVLNACHSAPLAEALAEHVDFAVGMAATIPDEGAIAFAWGFYHALAQGESLAAAFGFATAQLAAHCGPYPQPCPRLFATRCDPARCGWGGDRR